MRPLFFVVLACLLSPVVSAQIDQTNRVLVNLGPLPFPPYPLRAYENHEQGRLILRLKFDKEGAVADCRVLVSSGTADLDRPTVAFIKAHWRDKDFAGLTQEVPVTFVLPGGPKEPQSFGDINPLGPGSPDRTVVLNVSFGDEGWVRDVAVAQSSGLERLDQETMGFVWSHWRSIPYAGRTMRVPIEFKPKTAKPALSPVQAGG
jgi:TonB family protein